MPAKKPSEPKVTRRSLADYLEDHANANKGSERGLSMVEESLSQDGAGRSIVVDAENRIVAGNKTWEASALAGIEDVIEVETDGHSLIVHKRRDWDLTDVQGAARRYAYRDNRASEVSLQWDAEQLLADVNAGFDFEHLFSEGELAALLADVSGGEGAGGTGNTAPPITLSDRFIVPPFSVLDARQGYWQERKRQWLALGIQSEIGRGENALGRTDQAREDGLNHYRIQGKLPADSGGQPLPLDRTANGKAPARTFAQDLMRGEHVVGGRELATSYSSQARLTALQKTGSSHVANDAINSVFGRPENAGETQSQTGTSIFDPVLCELAYRWFSPPDGAVLDPFAGGSVRGIVAHLLGRRYTGIDLRAEQVAANEAQGAAITPLNPPRWVTGDSLDVQTLAQGAYDFVFTCPPYADLEIYSDDPRDISNMPYAAFLDAYRRIIAASCAMLNADRFAAIVVGDVRDKKGMYRNFVSDTISAFQDCGLKLYNEAILVTAVGSLPIRAGKQFSSGRKLGKTHQNVLVFVKGDPRKAAEVCGEIEVSLPDELQAVD